MASIQPKYVFEILTKIVYISNGRASGFQIPFDFQTICKQTRTSPDFKAPLYSLSTVHNFF